MFLKILMDSFNKILIDSFEDILVDQDRQFQNTRFENRQFQIFLDIYSPLDVGQSAWGSA